jgi:hypothetical protein
MHPEDLELYPTSDLIAELMRRQSFLGIVIHSEEEQKGQEWKGEKIFKVHFNANLDAGQVSRLLGAVTEHMEQEDGC